MNQTPSIHKVDSIDLSQFHFSKLYQTSNGIIKKTVKYSPRDSVESDLYIRTPQMYFGSDPIQVEDDIYIDLVADPQNPKSLPFLEFVRNIDYLAIAEIYANGLQWYPDQQDSPSLCQIECDYIPTIKLSTVYNDRQSLKIRAKSNQVEFFDDEGRIIAHKFLKEGYQTNAILRLSELSKNGDHSSVNWEVLQLKTCVPDVHENFDRCLLSDDSDDSEDDYVNDDVNFY
jgi:hypothetical protein